MWVSIIAPNTGFFRHAAHTLFGCKGMGRRTLGAAPMFIVTESAAYAYVTMHAVKWYLLKWCLLDFLIGDKQGFIQPFVSGGVWNFMGDDRVAEGRKLRVEAQSAEWGRVWAGGVPLPRDGGPGYHPRENFEIWGAIWCILARNWRFSSFPPLWRKYCHNARQCSWHSGPSPGGSKFVSRGRTPPLRGGWINPCVSYKF